MRKKEDANDYRYFPDPDLMPIVVPRKRFIALGGEMPQLPDERKEIYRREYALPAYDAELLVNSAKSPIISRRRQK
jgi:aspartyl-tRNA(Asn)/glutamyl-tRNA(Gln) amidotransferase subunit B